LWKDKYCQNTKWSVILVNILRLKNLTIFFVKSVCEKCIYKCRLLSDFQQQVYSILKLVLRFCWNFGVHEILPKFWWNFRRHFQLYFKKISFPLPPPKKKKTWEIWYTALCKFYILVEILIIPLKLLSSADLNYAKMSSKFNLSW